MNLHTSTKAQASYFPRFLFRMLILTIMVVIVVTIAYVFTSTPIDSRQAEATAIWTRLLYAPGGLSQTDLQTGEVSVGAIDMSIFDTPERLEDALALGTSQSDPSVRISLYDSTTLIKGPIYINKQGYDLYAPLAIRKIQGDGGATLYTRSFLVTYETQGKKHPGRIILDIVLPHASTRI
ncbi:MAG: hypothetical protein HC945_02155 [Nitrosarchaeum sp.]|nr:hypothetical protein [Nitrosarchaeum sp.]